MNSFVADAEFFRDFLIEKSLAEAIEHFLFALREIFGGLRRRTGFLKGLRYFAGDVSGHGRTATMHLLDRFQKFGTFRSLEKVSVGAGSQGAKNVVGVFVDREHDDLELGDQLFQLADAFDAVDAGQIDVHQNNLGTNFGQFLDGFFGGAVVTKALEAISAIQHAGERVAQLFVVFDDGDGDGHYKRESVA